MKNKEALNGVYYMFDCLGIIFDEDITGLPDNLTPVSSFKDDKEAIRAAANYEASLYKSTYKNNKLINNIALYEPAFF